MSRPFRHTDPGTPEQRWRQDPRWAQAPAVDLAALRGLRRLVVVAAHPDDETLGAAALLHRAAGAGLETVVLVLTDGEASHPRSPTHTPDDLARRRRRECELAVADCHPRARLERAGLPDGGLAAAGEQVDEKIREATGGLGAGVLLVAPYAHDGHPDHDATGAAARRVAAATGAALLEYPIWLWHHAGPDDLPWDDVLVLPLTPAEQELRRTALERHTSQAQPLSDAPGDGTLLLPAVRSHHERAWETYLDVAGTWETDVFERLHRAGADPWATETSVYEARKRGTLLDLLPARRYAHALEPGCSVGVLTAELAGRCERVTALDGSPTALERARRRCAAAGLDAVTFVQGRLPGGLPPGPFDLVVLSEVGYFLDRNGLLELCDRVQAALTERAVVALCHWRHPVLGWSLDGDTVHELALARLGLTGVAHHEEDDYVIDVLSTEPGDR